MTPDQWPARLLVVDVEGNGQQPPDLVELAAMPVLHGQLAAHSAESTLLRPPRPITALATGVHHLTNDDVANAPAWSDIAEKVQADMTGVWFAAHGAHTDYRLLQRLMPAWEPAGVIDTLRLARAVYPQAPRHGLDALITHVRLNLAAVPGQRHRAGYDAHVTALLLLEMAGHFTTWDALVAAAVPPGLPGTPPPDFEESTLW